MGTSRWLIDGFKYKKPKRELVMWTHTHTRSSFSARGQAKRLAETHTCRQLTSRKGSTESGESRSSSAEMEQSEA